MKRIYLILSFLLMINLTYADSNGIWNRAEDIREGIFGSDENATFFKFVNNVEFNANLTQAINAYSNKNHAIYAKTNAIGKASIYGFTQNNDSYSGYFNGGKFWVENGNLIVNNDNIGIGVSNPIERLEVAGNIKGEDIYSNEKKVATEEFVLDKVVDTVISVTNTGGSSSDSTYIYECPSYPDGSYRRQICNDCGYETLPCPSGCTGQLSTSPTCEKLVNNIWASGCVYQNVGCTFIGSLVSPSGMTKLKFPDEVVIDISGNRGPFTETYVFELPSSFVNNVKLNKIGGMIGYNSGHNGGSGYNPSTTRYLSYKVTNGVNSVTSDVFTSTSISNQNFIKLDLGDIEIIDRNLEIEFIYDGGDDDEWADYIAKNFFITFSGDIGDLTELISQ